MEEKSFTIQLPYHADSLTVRTDSEQIHKIFRDYYGQYFRAGDGGTITVTLRRSGDVFFLRWGENENPVPDPITALHNILYSTKKIIPGIFAMHAGAVCRDGKAYIFAASTTAGKTTLISYLTSSGFDYVSDDCVFIDMKDRAVYPLHNPIHLREGGVDVLRKYGTLPGDLTYADERYIFLPDNLSPRKMEIGAIFFITRADAVNSVTPIDGKTALNRLMFSPIVSYPISPDYIRFLHMLTPYCSELYYSDMKYVSGLIKESFH